MSEPDHDPDQRDRREHEADPRVGRARRVWVLFLRHKIELVVSALAALVLLLFAIDEIISRGRVPRGVRVHAAELSRLDPPGARRKLEELARALDRAPLAARVDGRSARMIPAESGLTVDVAATLARALEVDRKGGQLGRFAGFVRRTLRPERLEPVLRANQAALGAALDRVESEHVALPFAGGFRVEAGRIAPEYPRAGRRIDRQRARRELEQALARGTREVELPTLAVAAPVERAAVDRVIDRARALSAADVTLVDPESAVRLTLPAADAARALRVVPPRAGEPELEIEFDARELEAVIAAQRAALESAPKPARFEIDREDRVRVVPSEPDLRLDLRLLPDALLAAAASPKKRGSLPLARRNEPELTTAAAERLGIRGLVSAFTTRHPCCERRVENIHRIADLLDGLLVRPGETVSVNAVVGPRTTKNGFVAAPTIEEGEMVDSIGGGISQFATTLFNALFHGGYDIVERQPHTYWFPRYPMGHEATLSYPKPDVVFRNDTESGMLFDTQYTKTSITVRIFGDNGGRKVVAKVSPRQNVVEPPVEILANPGVPPDEERTVDRGMIGWSVIVGRVITFADGTNKEERRKVTYRPKVRRVEVHPCRVPKGEKGYTGERCPEPEDSALAIEGERPTE